ncbi:MAG: carbamoyltransferase [Rickettsiales bacterium]
MYILGISAFYHDSAACLIHGEQIIAAAQEERFTRKKHDPSFPANAIRYCLKEAGITLEEVIHIGFYDKPFLKFERLLETAIAEAPWGFRPFAAAVPVWLKEKMFLRKLLVDELMLIQNQKDRALEKQFANKLRFAEHHQSHAASCFYPSPYEEAAILTMDGVGEWATTSIAHGKGNDITFLKEIHFPHSLGLFYSAFTYYAGFKVNSGEYKLMGLAPYGEPKYADLIREHLIDIKEDGSFRLDMKYFNYTVGLTMTNQRFHDLFGRAPRKPESELTQFDMDIAASIQEVTEEIMLRLARTARKLTGADALVLAGGVALNCVGNGKILREKIFKHIWIQPAAGDAGGALGVAQSIYYQELQNTRKLSLPDGMQASGLGPQFSTTEIKTQLDALGAIYHETPEEELYDTTSKVLADGKVVGWFQGRMEYGPRALGARSILGDPRNTEMQSQINQKIKFRESFRPFAPAVLRERVSDYFEMNEDSPYMLLVAPVKESIRYDAPSSYHSKLELIKTPLSELPAITHVDYSARVQTVDENSNARFHNLLKSFNALTGCGVLVNTSFNIRGEPPVCTPEDAYLCFMQTHMDMLVIENIVLHKSEQDTRPAINSSLASRTLD